jgi:hypothetical protein
LGQGADPHCALQAQQYFDDFQWTLTGVQINDSGDNTWLSVALSAAAGAIKSLAGDSAGNIADKLENAVLNKKPSGDDYLGASHNGDNQFQPGIADWPNLDQLVYQSLSGQNAKGNIGLYAENRRVGGPRILDWSVRLTSLRVESKYHTENDPQDIYVQARALMYHSSGEQTLGDPARYPSTVRGDDLELNTYYQTWEFVPWKGEGQRTKEDSGNLDSGWELNPNHPSDPDTAVESPLLFIDLSVWEDDTSPQHATDDQDDLMGYHSNAIFLADFLSGLNDQTTVEVADSVWQDGSLIRTAKARFPVRISGNAGSDSKIYWGEAYSPDPFVAEGEVSLEYEVSVTWVKELSRASCRTLRQPCGSCPACP